MKIEDELVFVRITFRNGGSFEFTNGSADVIRGIDGIQDTITGGSGKFAVIKIRTGESLNRVALGGWDGNKEFPLYAGTTQLNPDVSLLDGKATGLFDREWHVYVIDLEALASEYYAANNAELEKASFGIQGETTNALGAKEYIDIAYFAICDDWTEVSEVVGNEQVILTKWTDNSIDQVLNSDGTEITE